MLKKWLSRVREPRSRLPDPGIVFVSYPKCGTTWTRVLLGKYVQLLSGAKALPLFDGAPYEAGTEAIVPPIRFTHEPLLWEAQRPEDLTVANTIAPFAAARVVLLIRHPLDALVSNYMQFRHQINRDVGDLPSFVADPVLGIEKLFAFYQLWARHHAKVREFFLLRYEDMRQDTGRELTRILEFLGLPLDAGIAREAIDFSSFEQMKALQSSPDAPVYPTSGFNIFGNVDPANPDSSFVRQGRVAGYRQSLPPDQCDVFERLIEQRLDPLYGYQALHQVNG